MQSTHLVFIFNLLLLLNLKDLIKLIRRYDNSDDYWTAAYNWYIQFKGGRQLLLINYMVYTAAFIFIYQFPNPAVDAAVPFYAAFALGMVPVAIHLYCNYWMWVLANSFNILQYYQKKMDEFKIINVLLNFLVGTVFWFITYANFLYYTDTLTSAFISHFFLMLFSWKHFLIVVLVQTLSVIVFKQSDFSEQFYDALYAAVCNNVSDEVSPSIQQIKTTTHADIFDLHLPSLMYACSDGNYTDVTIWQNNAATTLSKRITIKELFEQIKIDQRFYRCHKSYIVNLEQIEQVTGNSHGLKIRLKQISDTLIPVSRNQVPAFKEAHENFEKARRLSALSV